MKNFTEKMIALVTGILAILTLTAVACQAQFVNDCCAQTIEYKAKYDQLQIKYSELSTKYANCQQLVSESRKAGDDLLEQKETRIKQLQDEANTKLTKAKQEDSERYNVYQLKGTLLDLAISELQAEYLRGRFLGWGRRKWVLETLRKLQKSPATGL